MSHDHVCSERDQFRNESLCAIRLAGPPAIVYPKVVALRPTQLAEPLPKSIDTSLSFWIVLSICCKHADAPHPLCLLRADDEWPCGRAARKRDELTPFQLIEFPGFNISGSLAMLDATRLASSIVICFAVMASSSVERP